MPELLPKLRRVRTELIEHNGRPAILLHDPLGLSPGDLIVPQEIGPLLALCDGTRDISALRAGLLVRAGINISSDAIRRFLDQLDQALYLDNERFQQVKWRALQEYRAAPFRKPVSAGRTYPIDASELKSRLDAYFASVDNKPLAIDGTIRGLVSPHIDYTRGAPVYAKVWQAAAQAAREAEIVVIFGTDHMGGDTHLTPTRQNYSTPWGILPTDLEVVDALAEAIGEDVAFEEELNHLGEHSIELALVWLLYCRDGAPIKLVPILCGGFDAFMHGTERPGDHPILAQGTRALQEVIGSRRALIVAAADLAHVGPAFGDLLPLDFVARMRLEVTDNRLIDQICRGNADGFFNEIRAVQDKHHICGTSPIYLTLLLLSSSTGERIAYAQCPADASGTSWVTIAGIVSV